MALLGSCVAACMWDEDARIGGINHFLIPGGDDSPVGGLSYGVLAMGLLINVLIRPCAISPEEIMACVLPETPRLNDQTANVQLLDSCE